MSFIDDIKKEDTTAAPVEGANTPTASSAPANAPATPSTGYGDKPMKSYYKEIAPPVKPDTMSLKSSKRVVFSSDTDIPEEIMNKLTPLLKFLKDRGFTSAMIPDPKDMFLNKLSNSGISMFTVMPHGFFNEDITPTLKFPTNDAQEAGVWFVGVGKDGKNKADKLPNFVRSIIACRINLMLGKELDSLARFAVIYTPEGAELDAERDFKLKRRNTDGVIEMCTRFGVPVFNLGNTTAFARLEEYIKSLIPATPAAETPAAPAPVPETPVVPEALPVTPDTESAAY